MTSNSTVHIFHRCAVNDFGGESALGQQPADPGCWEIFIQTYSRLLRSSIRTAFYRCGAPFVAEDVEEAQQEVYCRLLEGGRRRLQQFRGNRESQARHFLRRVSWSVVIDSLRWGSAQKRGGDRARRTVRFVEETTRTSLSNHEPTPEVEVLRRERYRQLARSCRSIASRSSHGRRNLRILRLAVLEGRSSREIARCLDFELSISAIDSVVHRMRRDLASEGLRLPGRQL